LFIGDFNDKIDTAHASHHVTRTRAQKQPHNWNSRPLIFYSQYNVYGAMTAIKGRFIVKHFHAKISKSNFRSISQRFWR